MSGKLDLVLHQLVNYLEKSIKLQRGLITALIYPLVVIITTIVVCATLLIFVIPTFSELFYEVGAELPLSTRTVIYLGNFCQSSLPWLLATFISVVVGGLFAGTTSRGVELYLGFMLKLPSVGGFLRRVTAARFLRNLAIMLASGVAIVDGLAVCAETLSFPRSKTFMDRATGDLCEGRTLSEALSHLPFLSPLSLQMLAIGESTGSSDVIVDKLAEMYETEIESYISALKQLIEPILILFIAGFVGAIVFAMYAPIFSLGGVMGQS